ncbi:MAG: DUF134 domain-containing protein [Candidatus Methylomirabilota bacterium]
MPRPCKVRQVCCRPASARFKPAGVPGCTLETLTLSLDELESLRLSHLEGLYQEEAAGRMGVSRATFGAILAAAHRTVADMLVNGKMIIIEGGPVTMDDRGFTCSACQHAWTLPHGKARSAHCPACGSTDLHRTDPGAGRGLGACKRRKA